MSDFALNLKFVMEWRNIKQTQLAEEIKIHRTVLSKMSNGLRSPNSDNISKIEKFFGFEKGTLNLSHADFQDYINKNNASSNLTLNKIRSIEHNKRRWASTSLRYSGDYLVYYLQNENGKYVCSYMKIGESLDDGIEIIFINPHLDASGNKSYYKYKGYMFPLSGFLYCFLEQDDNDYEIFSIIMLDSGAPQPSIVMGMISGIQANFDNTFIAARPIVIKRCTSTIRDWSTSSIAKQITYMDQNNVPEMIKNKISNERITIRPSLNPN